MLEDKDFDAAAAAAGLKMEPAERLRMLEGYAGLKTLLARIPDMALAPDEPATVYLMPSTSVQR